MSGPSRHLSWKEIACNDGTPYPQRFINDGRVFKLAQAFEDIRFLCGGNPIIVLSAYRTPTWNRKVGGAPNSQHVQGRALDLRPPKNLTIQEFYNLIRANCYDFGISGLGHYETFVHIDIRPANRLYVWSGTGLKESKA